LTNFEPEFKIRGTIFKGTESVKILEEEAKKGLSQSIVILEKSVVDKTPVGVSEGLRGSITSAIRGTGINIDGVVFSSKDYAPPVELGIRPLSPPPGPIEFWVTRVLGLSGNEMKRTAFFIIKKISERGIKAVGMFRKSLAENEAKVAGFMEKARDRIIERLNK